MKLSYNKKIIKATVFSVILAAGGAFIVGSNFKHQDTLTKAKENVEKYENPKTDLPQKSEDKGVSEKPQSTFLIKEYNGNVAVFQKGETSPFKTTETMVSDLPTADRELLKKGINVESQEELSRILEDYCS